MILNFVNILSSSVAWPETFCQYSELYEVSTTETFFQTSFMVIFTKTNSLESINRNQKRDEKTFLKYVSWQMVILLATKGRTDTIAFENCMSKVN